MNEFPEDDPVARLRGDLTDAEIAKLLKDVHEDTVAYLKQARERKLAGEEEPEWWTDMLARMELMRASSKRHDH